MSRIREATPEDAARVAEIYRPYVENTVVTFETVPPDEAEMRSRIVEHLKAYPYLVMEEDGRIVAFVNGMATDEPTIRDEMFADASLHNEQGAWQAIFGVNTLPEYRRQGRAARLLQQAAADAKAQGRKGCILTCKDRLVHYYASLGYFSEGVSDSVHGGAVWYDMRLTF